MALKWSSGLALVFAHAGCVTLLDRKEGMWRFSHHGSTWCYCCRAEYQILGLRTQLEEGIGEGQYL